MSDIKEWSVRHFLALPAGDEPLLSRLREDGEYAVRTFFSYPGRQELVIYLMKLERGRTFDTPIAPPAP